MVFMDKMERDVRKFMHLFGQACPEKPTLADFETRRLRYSLILEELHELQDAYAMVGQDDVSELDSLTEVADSLIDILYVTYGALIAHGLPIQALWDEVAANNLTKIGGGKDKNGKVQKPANYEPPKIREILMFETCE